MFILLALIIYNTNATYHTNLPTYNYNTNTAYNNNNSTWNADSTYSIT